MQKEHASTVKAIECMRVVTPEEGAISARDVFGFLWARMTNEKRAFYRLGVLLALQAVVVGGSVWLLKTGVDNYFDSQHTFLLLAALSLATVGKSLLDFLFSWTQNLTVARVRDALLAEAYADLLRSPFSFHVRERNSRKYGWVLEDTSNFVGSCFGLLQVWLKQPIQVVSSIVALAVIDWKLTAFGLLAVPIVIPCIQFFRRKSAQFIAQRKVLLGQLEDRIAETIYGIRMVKVFGLEARERRRVQEIIDKQRSIHEANAFYIGLTGPVAETLGLLGVVLVLLLGTQSIFSGSFTTGTFVAFMMAFFNIYRPLKDFSRGTMMFQMAMDAGRRLILLKDQAKERSTGLGENSVSRFQSIEYQGVWFSYGDESDESGSKWVLRDIHCRINRGETILMTGVSGAGKSTTCDLMFRLFRPQRGSILVNGLPIESLDPDSHRRLFAMCSQETIVFNETLLENIRVARPQATRAQVCEAARVAQISEAMLDRLDAVIGDRGMQLSGGERQRLALARAVLCRPDFLLLDEALNNLDPETEARIWKGLREYLPDSTMLVVSHRWLDLNQYDRLLVLANGRLIEDVPIANDRAAASTVLEKYRTAARSVLN